MPTGTYRVTLSDGRRITVESDHTPTEAEILSQLGGGAGTQADSTGATLTPGVTAPSSAAPAPQRSPQRDWVDTAASWIPTVAGAAGGLAGGATGLFGAGVGALPGAVGGAAAGGALGRGVEEAIEKYRHPDQHNLISLGTLKNMALEGAVQGGSELVGAGVGKVLGATGKAVYRKMLKPSISARLAERAPEIVETGLREGVNPFAPKSLAKVEPTIQDLNAQVEGIVGSTGSAPVAHPLPVARRLQRVANKFAGSGADPADRAAVQGVKRNFLRDQTALVPGTPTTKLQPTGVLDASGNPVFRPVTTTPTVRRLQPMSGEELLKARRSTGASAGSTSFGITRGAETEARKELYHELGTELGSTYPTTKPLMNRERQLIDLKDTAEAAVNREANRSVTSLRHLVPLGLGVTSFGLSNDPKSAAEYWLTAEMLANPRLMTRAAMLAWKAGAYPQALATIPRLGANLVRQANED